MRRVWMFDGPQEVHCRRTSLGVEIEIVNERDDQCPLVLAGDREHILRALLDAAEKLRAAGGAP